MKQRRADVQRIKGRPREDPSRKEPVRTGWFAVQVVATGWIVAQPSGGPMLFPDEPSAEAYIRDLAICTDCRPEDFLALPCASRASA